MGTQQLEQPVASLGALHSSSAGPWRPGRRLWQQHSRSDGNLPGSPQVLALTPLHTGGPADTPLQASSQAMGSDTIIPGHSSALHQLWLRSLPHKHYTSPCPHWRVAVKIPGCHPSDLPALAAWEEWLTHARSRLADTQYLQKVSFRAGCIQMVLDFVEHLVVEEHPQSPVHNLLPAAALPASPGSINTAGTPAPGQPPGSQQDSHVSAPPDTWHGLNPEQLLAVLDPALLTGRQVVVQADWLSAGGDAGDGGGGRAHTWLITCGEQLQPPQPQQQQAAADHDLGLAAPSTRCTVLTWETGQQLPVTIQRLPDDYRHTLIDVDMVLPPAVACSYSGPLVLHVLASVRPAPHSSGDQVTGQGSSSAELRSSGCVTRDAGWWSQQALQAYVRTQSGYMPCGCSLADPAAVQQVMSRDQYEQVQQLVACGELAVLCITLDYTASHAPLPPGLLHVDVNIRDGGPLMGRSGYCMVAPSAAVAAEVCSLAADLVQAGLDAGSTAATDVPNTSPEPLLCDLALLMGLLHRMEATAEPSAGLPPWAGQLAMWLLLAAVSHAWPHTASAMCDALVVLGVTWSSVEQVAVEREGMSLLHCLVRSRCTATTAAVLTAAASSGHTWQLKGLPADNPRLTALHLAAVLPHQAMAAGMVEQLIRNVPSAAAAWHHWSASSEPHSSPADMARCVGNTDALAVAELLLGAGGTSSSSTTPGQALSQPSHPAGPPVQAHTQHEREDTQQYVDDSHVDDQQGLGHNLVRRALKQRQQQPVQQQSVDADDGVAATTSRAGSSGVGDGLQVGRVQCWLKAAGLAGVDAASEARYAHHRAAVLSRTSDQVTACLSLLLAVLSILQACKQASVLHFLGHVALHLGFVLPYLVLMGAPGTYRHHREGLLMAAEGVRLLQLLLVACGCAAYPQPWIEAASNKLTMLFIQMLRGAMAQVRVRYLSVFYIVNLMTTAHLCSMAAATSPAGLLSGQSLVLRLSWAAVINLLALVLPALLDMHARQAFLAFETGGRVAQRAGTAGGDVVVKHPGWGEQGCLQHGKCSEVE